MVPLSVQTNHIQWVCKLNHEGEGHQQSLMGFSSHWNPITEKVSFTISQRADQCRVEMEQDNRKIEEEESREASIQSIFLISQIIVALCIFTCLFLYDLSHIFSKNTLLFFTVLVMLASLVVPYEYLKCSFCLNLFSNMHIHYPFQFNQDSEGNLFLSLLKVSQGHIQSKQCFVGQK